MMTFTQWLLGQLAGEASELALAATKAQQFGTVNLPPGYNNTRDLVGEYRDVVTVMHLLTQQPEFDEYAGSPEFLHGDVKLTTKQRIFLNRKACKISYYAIGAIGNGVFHPTQEEYYSIHTGAQVYNDMYHQADAVHKKTFEGLLAQVTAQLGYLVHDRRPEDQPDL